jgi:hypothetical protein
MRPRHILVLVVLAAIPVGLAFLLTGGGGGGTSAVPAVLVSLELVGGGSSGPIAACGITHHYTTYAAGSTISFRGTISSKGQWRVKVKLKACTAGAFQSAGEASARVHAGSRYEGSFPTPIGGYYFARAEVKRGGAIVGRGDKSYFEVR